MTADSQTLQLAVQYHQANSLTEAEQSYRQVLEQQPNHPEALYGLGMLAQQMGKPQVAEELLSTAVSAQPKFFKAWFSLGNVRQAQGQLPKAEAAYKQAIASKSDVAPVYNNLGYTLQEQGKFDEAISCYQKALEIDPNCTEADVNWGNTLHAQGKLSPDKQLHYAKLNHKLGLTRKQVGDLKNAVAYYRQAINLQPDFVEAHYHLGVVLQIQGKLKAAIGCYQKALEIQPDCAVIPYKLKLNFETMPYPQYAYGTYHAALQAKALGIESISVIEFGVAGGNGLVALENIAQDIEEEVGVKISVYGFDTGEGMPKILDYRDLPYVWQKGFFKMDVELLKARLKKAKLILGDVKDTIKTFPKEESPAPIGFISFDLDYYSSTAEAFQLFNEPDTLFLPRVFCYFDDCIGDDWELHSEFTGELLLIKEFNDKNDKRKLAKINGLRYKRIFESPWNEVMYVLHSFEHHLYCQHINPRKDWQMPLK